MHINRGTIAEAGREVIKSIVGTLFLRAYAEEKPAGETPPPDTKGGEGDNPSTSGSTVINYEDLIAKARKEEKDKQYKAIEKLKTQVATLTQQHNDDLLRIAAAERERDEAKTALTKAGSGDTEAVTTLKNEVATLQGEKATLEKKVADYEKNKPASREEIEAQVRQELEAEYQVKTYKVEQLAAHPEILVPELVIGDSKEAIDQSITAAIARSEEIRKSLGVQSGGDPKNTPPATKPAKRTPRSSSPGVEAFQNTGVTMDKLATMDVSSPEYAELRKKLGLA